MAVADAEGMPIAVAIEEGSRHDVGLVDHVLDQAVTTHIPPILIGDKAFDSQPLAQRLAHERGVRLITPKRRKRGAETARQDGRHMRRYRRRWKVECLFAWLAGFAILAAPGTRDVLSLETVSQNRGAVGVQG